MDFIKKNVPLNLSTKTWFLQHLATEHRRPCVCDSSSCPRGPSPPKTTDVDGRLSPPKRRERALYLNAGHAPETGRGPFQKRLKSICQHLGTWKGTLSWKINRWNLWHGGLVQMMFNFSIGWFFWRLHGNFRGVLSLKFAAHLPHTPAFSRFLGVY